MDFSSNELLPDNLTSALDGETTFASECTLEGCKITFIYTLSKKRLVFLFCNVNFPISR